MIATTNRTGPSMLKKGPSITHRGPSRGYYLESEAASLLGLTREDFRALVRRVALHPEGSDISSARYQPTDLVTLRLAQAGALPSSEPGSQPA
ncbi:MAG: hypothetical protein SFV51_03425 [Bryobacteraceae bacterium]|nr:hypothetical protein [Bryobacteraceae bacterium]